MHELHENEQYFFDEPTLTRLADFVSAYEHPCCICSPMLGKRLVERGQSVRILDIDTRFASLPGFQPYNLYRPEYLDERFDLIVCDPPFFNVSLSQLFTALRLLAHHDYAQPMLVSYLTRREANLLGAFSRFNLTPTGFLPGYVTVQSSERNEIAFYGNLGDEAHARLRGETDPEAIL